MTMTDTPPSISSPLEASPDPKRYWSLAVIALAQLMIVLDASVVIVALPSAQHALHISVANRQWVMSSYTLAFGSLLLLGGRIADYLGRRRMFIVGLLGFGAASALGGLAQNVGHALRRPGPAGRLRRRHGPGRSVAAHRHLHRGPRTGPRLRRLRRHLRWRRRHRPRPRRDLDPVGLLALDPAHQRAHRRRRRHRGHAGSSARAGAESTGGYDLPGAVTVTGGLFLLVYGFTMAGTHGWAAPLTVAFLVGAALLLAVFTTIELRSPHPLLPLRVVLDRNRGGSFLASLLVGSALLGTFLFLTYLLPGNAALLGAQDRLRLPALLGRDHPGRRPGQPSAAPRRSPGV